MEMFAYRRLRNPAPIQQAKVLVMDEGSYSYLGFSPNKINVVISLRGKPNFPDCLIFPQFGEFAREMFAGEGRDNVLVVGESLYDLAAAYGAKQL